MRWRYLISPPRDGAFNMALDDALLARAGSSGESVLRIYGWSRPTLSLGRNQVARHAYDLERAGHLGVEFVRRPTGGRALLHHREVTYSVTAPVRGLGDLHESYDRINRLLIEALHALGAEAEIAVDTGSSPPPDVSPCFERPVGGEIVADGRKLVGSAQYREGGALLQHGSILIEDDQALAAKLLRQPKEPPPPTATLASLLGGAPTRSDVAERLVDALHRLEDPAATPLAMEDRLDEAAHLAATRYRDVEWTWRR